MTLIDRIQSKFGTDEFTLNDVYEEIQDKPKTTIRGRIYDNLGIKLERVKKGVYKAIDGDSQCILVEGDGRDLSFLEDNSVDCIITDHPWEDKKSHNGGSRKFTSEYSCFRYRLEDFKEKARVLKEGSFLVEILPSENENNFDYLYDIKCMAKECGLLYYSKVIWKKGTFVSNTGRKAKNTEDVMIFTKGKARDLRIDAKKTKAMGSTNYMSGTNGMLPTMFDVQSVSNKAKIHQAEKPPKLYEQIIDFVTKEGEVILDQFAGSGNVGVAALSKNRNCILIEIIKENIEKIRTRLGNMIEVNKTLEVQNG